MSVFIHTNIQKRNLKSMRSMQYNAKRNEIRIDLYLISGRNPIYWEKK
jgi:hypothetical protein